MSSPNEFHGANEGYVLELYDRFRRDPASVDEATRTFFATWSPPSDGAPPGRHAARDVSIENVSAAVNLANCLRSYGHRAAQLDIPGMPPPGDPSLNPSFHGLSGEDLRRLPAWLVGGPASEHAANAFEAIRTLRQIYTTAIGFDFEHIHNPEQRTWLREAAESRSYRAPMAPFDPVALLDRLTEVEVFERFLHRMFPGKFRFSIEGLDMMVPMLDQLIGQAAERGLSRILIGMAHRGRLNVLAHVLSKPYAHIVAEFKDQVEKRQLAAHDELGWTGDVKYHLGTHRAVRGGTAVDLSITMVPNPSHLEFTNPVAQGMARAAGTSVDRAGAPQFDHTVTLPILVHGDAAFVGEGVVAETLNLARLSGYRTGGTIHIIANNQLGFTTTPGASRSTLYASDLAKGFEIPVIHVNADDPEACIEAVRLGFNYLVRFQDDVLIDLVGYRRHGHNEGDEPAFTQPILYDRIARHPTVRKLWADTLVKRELIDQAAAEQKVTFHMDRLRNVLESAESESDLVVPQPYRPPPGVAGRVETAVLADRLRTLNEALSRVPAGFTIHRKLQLVLKRRLRALENLDEPGIDWAAAEALAFASILEDGFAIRLTGQDSERGTFSHRHAVFHDVKTGERYVPLQALPQAHAAFEVHNSPLTENAILGFEYGYNIEAPTRLVLWEAQYGDFINAAQVMIDEFLTSARAKWGQTPSMVLLLPHGSEGQGPDHSSARVERFLELAVDINMRIASPTTAAQYFHLLRRQALLLRTDPLPLVVLTPKSLLRQPLVGSSLRDLSEGTWQPVIDDARAREDPEQIRRLICVTGKVYVDLVKSKRREESPSVAVARVEQLYPFPVDPVRKVVAGYPRIKEVVWVQEEPENMGTWSSILASLETAVEGRAPIYFLGRHGNASPAEGSAAWFKVNQARLVEEAFTLEAGTTVSAVGTVEKAIVWRKVT